MKHVQILAFAALACALPGQTTKPTSQPSSEPFSAPEAKAEAEKTQEPTPPVKVDTLKLLEHTLQIAMRERDHLRQVSSEGGLVKRFLRNRDETRQMEMKMRPSAMGPTLPERKKARLLGDRERETLAEDVVFTVEGAPVTESELDAMEKFVKTFPQQDNTQVPRTRAIMLLIEAKAGIGAFGADSQKARAGIEAAQKELENGASFSDVAAKFSDDEQTKDKGGKRGFEERGAMDGNYARGAFETKLGKVSPIVVSIDGYHLIRVLGRKDGETADKDRISTAHVVKHHTSDNARLAELRHRVAMGAVEVAFRENNLRKLAPEQFK